MENRSNKSPHSGDPQKDRQIRKEGPQLPDSLNMDDSVSDEERLQQDTSYIVLPDVSDIPGQENIASAGVPGAMSDSTPSSGDEEGLAGGRDILDDDDTRIVMGTEADVTAEDLALLGPRDHDMDMGDDERTDTEGLDDTDLDGDPLNEAATSEFSTGEDLDLPAHEGSDPLADGMGQGDEENDYYSLGDDDNDNDNTTEGAP